MTNPVPFMPAIGEDVLCLRPGWNYEINFALLLIPPEMQLCFVDDGEQYLKHNVFPESTAILCTEVLPAMPARFVAASRFLGSCIPIFTIKRVNVKLPCVQVGGCGNKNNQKYANVVSSAYVFFICSIKAIHCVRDRTNITNKYKKQKQRKGLKQV